MASGDPERMKGLLSQERRKKRATDLVEQWASRHVPVSPIAQKKHVLITDRLRRGHSRPPRRTNDLAGEVRDFVAADDVIAIIGWDVEEEPILLVGADRLAANVVALNVIYPEGFVLVSDAAGHALLVDFDVDVGTYVNTVVLPASTS